MICTHVIIGGALILCTARGGGYLLYGIPITVFRSHRGHRGLNFSFRSVTPSWDIRLSVVLFSLNFEQWKERAVQIIWKSARDELPLSPHPLSLSLFTHRTLSHLVMYYMYDRRLTPPRSKEVQLTNGLQSCLGHPNGTCV